MRADLDPALARPGISEAQLRKICPANRMAETFGKSRAEMNLSQLQQAEKWRGVLLPAVEVKRGKYLRLFTSIFVPIND